MVFRSKQKQVSILVLLILVLIAINYPFLDNLTENFLSPRETVKVIRIIDGDTIEANISGKIESIRLLGINTPEQGELYYEESKTWLENLILNKTVSMEQVGETKDKYNRLLRYIYYENKNVNKELIEQGYANIYFLRGKTKYYNEFSDAWEQCISKNINSCEKSIDVCANCAKISELNVQKQTVTLQNVCNFNCNLKNWEIKDEGRKKFIFSETNLGAGEQISVVVGQGNDDEDTIFWDGEDYVWTSTGDTLFLRDSDGKLVVFESY